MENHRDPITGMILTEAGAYELSTGVRQMLQLPAVHPSENALLFQPLISFQLDALELVSETGADEQVSGVLGASDNSDGWTCPDDYRYDIYALRSEPTSSAARLLETLRVDPRGSTLVHVPIVTITPAKTLTYVFPVPLPMSPGDAFNLATAAGGATNGTYDTIVWYKRFRIFAGSPGWSSVTS